MIPLQTAMRSPLDRLGFRLPAARELGREHRTAAFAELAASIALALSTVVVATVLSVGIARANVAMKVLAPLILNSAGNARRATVPSLNTFAWSGFRFTIPSLP